MSTVTTSPSSRGSIPGNQGDWTMPVSRTRARLLRPATAPWSRDVRLGRPPSAKAGGVVADFGRDRPTLFRCPSPRGVRSPAPLIGGCSCGRKTRPRTAKTAAPTSRTHCPHVGERRPHVDERLPPPRDGRRDLGERLPRGGTAPPSRGDGASMWGGQFLRARRRSHRATPTHATVDEVRSGRTDEQRDSQGQQKYGPVGSRSASRRIGPGVTRGISLTCRSG